QRGTGIEQREKGKVEGARLRQAVHRPDDEILRRRRGGTLILRRLERKRVPQRRSATEQAFDQTRLDGYRARIRKDFFQRTFHSFELQQVEQRRLRVIARHHRQALVLAIHHDSAED